MPSFSSPSVIPLSLVVGLLLAGCAISQAPEPERWDFSLELGKGHVFTPGVVVWQTAVEIERLKGVPPSENSTQLALAYSHFGRGLRRQTAREVLKFVQTSSGLYFRPDGKFDYWPTLNEVIARGGDDCDGMDVLTFELLRRSGFGPGEIYRTVLFNQKRDLHHMATLWFEVPGEHDPWVLDPTREISGQMRRLSEVPAWIPLVMFDEERRFEIVSAGDRSSEAR